MKQNARTQADKNKTQYMDIHKMADELLHERRVSDPAALNIILQNLDDNWQDLQELLEFRYRDEGDKDGDCGGCGDCHMYMYVRNGKGLE